jgi:hypothetical protein
LWLRAPGLPHKSSKRSKLYDESKHKGWVVISMKSDWNEIFPPTTVGGG